MCTIIELVLHQHLFIGVPNHPSYNAFASALEGHTAAIDTVETGLPNSESSVETSTMNGLQNKLAFRAKLKSFEENDLGTIKETVAILEAQKEESSDFEKGNSSTPNLMTLTVNMPYGSFLGHEVPPHVSRSQPDLHVKVSLTEKDKIVSSVTRMTSTTDLVQNDVENESDYDDDDNEDSYSSCSAGSNSSCSSSFDENCPHCIISVNSKATFTGDENRVESPVFL